MNILLLTTEGGIAGSTYSISYLAKGLALHGNNVIVACPLGSLLYTLLHNKTPCIVVPIYFKSKFDPAAIRQLKSIVIRYDIQIINAQDSITRYITILSKWLYRFKAIVVHTRRQMPLSMGGFLQNFFYRLGSRKIIAVSEGVKHALIGPGMPEKHIIVIRNGTPEDKYNSINHTLTNSIRSNLKISDNAIIIGCVSRRKKQDQLLKAILNIHKPLTVIFIGTEKQDSDVRIINRFKTNHTIHFVGTISPDEVLPYYDLFTLKVLCSTTEGISQALLEAMYLKIPVIATRAGGNTDLIFHEQNGLLFEDGNIPQLSQCIKKIIDHPEYATMLGENGKKTVVKNYSIDRTVNEHEQLYKELCRTG